jgi:outer membrane protein, heavy metal efflux system
VLSAYFDLARSEELVRIDQDELTLLKLLADSASTRAEAGGAWQDLLKALIDSRTAEGELASEQAKAASIRSTLNGMLARGTDAPLILPSTLPAPRPIPAQDSRLIAVAVTQNPELAVLAQQVAGRQDAVEMARLAFLPDFSPSASITGSVSKSLGAMVMLPTRAPALRAAINEAQAMLASSDAMLRQTGHDRAANFVADLYLVRNAERQIQLYRERVLPAARELVASSRSAYAVGSIGFADLADSERMLLSMRRMVAEVQIDREERLVELEALAGVDIETLSSTPDATVRPAPVGLPDSQAGGIS